MLVLAEAYSMYFWETGAVGSARGLICMSTIGLRDSQSQSVTKPKFSFRPSTLITGWPLCTASGSHD